jgi:hypothetical protein
MTLFRIIPLDRSDTPAELISRDASGVLSYVAERQWQGADVLQDEDYVFSVRLSAEGFWTVFQRDEGGNSRLVPNFSYRSRQTATSAFPAIRDQVHEPGTGWPQTDDKPSGAGPSHMSAMTAIGHSASGNDWPKRRRVRTVRCAGNPADE